MSLQVELDRKNLLRNTVILNLVMAVVYTLLGHLARIMSIPPGNVTAFWPASGLALALMLCFGYRLWPGLLCGNIAANLPAFFDPSSSASIGTTSLVGLGIGVGDVLQTVTACYGIHRYIERPFKGFFKTGSLGWFLVICSISHTLSPSFGVSALYFGGLISPENFLYTWITWYTGDLLGALYVSVFVMDLIGKKSLVGWSKSGVLGLIVIPAISYYLVTADRNLFFLIFLFPFVVFFTVSYRGLYVSTLNIGIVFASIGALIGSIEDPKFFNERLMAMESFMFVLFLINNIILAFINERESLRKELDEVALLSMQNSKLAALGEMAGGVAHEVKNPLAIIEGHARIAKRLLIKDADSQGKVLERLTKIQDMVRRIDKIIHGMKSLTHSSVGEEASVFRADQLVEDIKSISAERLKTLHIEFVVDARHDLQIYGNRIQISQVVLNLLNNAVDAMVDHEVESGRILLKMMASDGGISIDVINSGPKIPVDIVERVFDPFFTTKEVGHGTGMGLSISQRIMSNHGGRLTLVPNTEETTFRMTLPGPPRTKTSA
ncbi:ATP-binding protein [Pseudobacteriovorax antillogorgiicola]|uniref:histidine kinase n=1 Tax=Pseudobacteriovorax antillogorgiicola TaxID=1513793 RepID=A0A1Y6BEN3_9BACT|nr:ATP-binding protein [Pseudobacteriovorax antillogorgiicola]TCS56314.1 phospho-acceptor domain-containing protein [Pseudobacteriovorax antillogorgiicola]SMF07176.1 His Kinase A (phospho-acceptor) domain-containing protein [Pseudobacteriovorax antillogorgiicola]